MQTIEPSTPDLGAAIGDALRKPITYIYLMGALLGYRLLQALYNISPFHPLYRFPGPKLAAASYLYEAYYDWILKGRFGRDIARMHKLYGPIVRINPDELHCSDPYFADEIFASGNRIRDKWQHQLNTGSVGPVSLTGFATVPHEIHRVRRNALSRCFSRQQVSKLEGEVRELSQHVVDKMLQSAGGDAFDIKEAFNCFTADVISQFAFGHTMDFVAQDGWEPNFATWVKSFLNSAYMIKHNALARNMIQIMPMISNYMGEDIKNVMRQMTIVIPGYIQSSLRDPDSDRVFAELQNSKVLPPEDKSLFRFTGEAFSFLLAGTETTAGTLTFIIYHLMAQPRIYARLMESLAGLDPTNLSWVELEQRPYFWAIFQESLRMMPGVSHRSTRIARNEDLVYKSQDGKTEHIIERGTPISMTPMINHWNKALFPDPDEFIPERWLVDGQPNHKLQTFLIAFGKGGRSCIGSHLASAEVYHMIALMAFHIIPRARLHETTIDDVSYDHDLIIAQTKKGSTSVRVKIK